MKQELIDSMRAVVDTHTELSGRCCWCDGRTKDHNGPCPVEDFEAFLAEHDAPKGPTQRVEIHLLMDADKRWGAAGCGGGERDQMLHEAKVTACELGNGGFAGYYETFVLHAEIPIPGDSEPPTIEAEVVPGEKP